MKKILIIAGLVLIVALLAIWLFMSGASSAPDGVFANLGFGNTTDPSVPQDQNFFEEEFGIDNVFVEENRLRQLTSTPVVGYAEVLKTASSTPEIYYVEAGTSHVYRLDPVSFEASRLSNTTVTDVTKAVFSKDGGHVALLSDKLTILTLPDSIGGEVTSFSIFDAADDVTIIDGQLLYLIETTSGASVKRYDLGTKLASETFFTIPFREVAIAWGNDVAGPHYYYPKPAASMVSPLYSWQTGAVTRELVSEYGLVGTQLQGYLLFKGQDSILRTYSNDVIQKVAINTVTEKCATEMSGGPLVCAAPKTESGIDYGSWLRGETGSDDQLLLVDIENGSVVSLDSLSNNFLDIVGIKSVRTGLLMMDRATGNLWQYNVTW